MDMKEKYAFIKGILLDIWTDPINRNYSAPFVLTESETESAKSLHTQFRVKNYGTKGALC